MAAAVIKTAAAVTVEAVAAVKGQLLFDEDTFHEQGEPPTSAHFQMPLIHALRITLSFYSNVFGKWFIISTVLGLLSIKRTTSKRGEQKQLEKYNTISLGGCPGVLCDVFSIVCFKLRYYSYSLIGMIQSHLALNYRLKTGVSNMQKIRLA